MKHFQYFVRAFDVFCFIYIASIAYRNLKINGVVYGVYLRPIAAIPALLVFVVAVGVQYIARQIAENKTISATDIKKDLFAGLAHFAVDLTNSPSKVFFGSLWASIKMTFKNMLIFMLLLVPLSLVVAIVQTVITGSGSWSASF